MRTPLNAILGFSEIIQSASANRQFSEYGGYIHGSGKHLLALINDILDLAKIEAGRMTLRESEMEIAPAMEHACMMMATRAQGQRLSMRIEIDPRFPPLHADDRAVRQILTNLVSNAVKFTPEGGRVTVFAYLRQGQRAGLRRRGTPAWASPRPIWRWCSRISARAGTTR